MNKKLMAVIFAFIFCMVGCGKDDSKQITEMAMKIEDAKLYHFYFISGPVPADISPLADENNPYPTTKYFRLDDNYGTIETIKDKASRYYTTEFIENNFLNELEPRFEGQPPYLLEYDGKLYCNLNYGLGGPMMYKTETVKIINRDENIAEFEIERYHPLDETSIKKVTVTLVKENGRWLYNQRLFLIK